MKGLIVGVAVAVTLVEMTLGRVVHLPHGWVDVLVWSCAGIVLCVVALAFVHRLGPRAVVEELGLVASPFAAAALVGVASVAPMIVLLLAHDAPTLAPASTFLPLVVFGPVGEEVVFRGYLFQQLRWRAGWGFWASATLSSALFGLAHVHSLAATQAAPMAVVVPAVGGFFFAWLLERWNGNLWVPLGVHASMNFWWEVLHSTGDPAASQHAELARAVFVALAVVKTLRETADFERASTLAK